TGSAVRASARRDTGRPCAKPSTWPRTVATVRTVGRRPLAGRLTPGCDAASAPVTPIVTTSSPRTRMALRSSRRRGYAAPVNRPRVGCKNFGGLELVAPGEGGCAVGELLRRRLEARDGRAEVALLSLERSELLREIRRLRGDVA